MTAFIVYGIVVLAGLVSAGLVLAIKVGDLQIFLGVVMMAGVTFLGY